MRAVVFEEFGGPLRVTEVPEPACPPAGAVIRVEATGVCRSDWHGWQGHDGGIALPHVPGHEFAGTVERVGPLVHGWSGGERVTVPFVCACGTCGACLAGEHQVCERQTQPGFTHAGSFAELVAIDFADVNLVALPEGMPATTAASLGCRFATAYRALTVHGRVRPGDWVAVHGCGGVGLSAVMIATALGARVVAVDPSGRALDVAKALGAQITIEPPSSSDPYATGDLVARATEGGAHVSIDALGAPAIAAASVLGLRRRGRHVQVGLLLGADAHAALPMDRVVAWELEVYGSHGMAAHEYPAMLEQIAAGLLTPGKLVGRVVGLDEAPAALEAMGGAPAGEAPDREAPVAAGMTVVEPYLASS